MIFFSYSVYLLSKHFPLALSLPLFSVLVLLFPPLSLSDLQRFLEPGARHHGPSGAPGQDDSEGKNKEQLPTQKNTITSSPSCVTTSANM